MRIKEIALAHTILVLFLTCQYAHADAVSAPAAEKHILYGAPACEPPTHTRIDRTIYVLCNNAETKFADWLAYTLDAATITGESKTERKWKRDPDLPADATLSPNDYKDANKVLKVDRGHQAPLASFKGTAYWSQTNYLSNITPQKAALNQGPWKRVEDAVRVLATTRTVYVMTGPLYERKMSPLPKASKPHRVPSGYWKIIAVRNPDAGQAPLLVLGFIFDQDTPRSDSELDHVATINDIEQHSGLNFFHDLPDDLEEHMESVNTLVLQ